MFPPAPAGKVTPRPGRAESARIPGRALLLLENKVCGVTGAASARGIGKATARLFAAHGGRVLDLDAGLADAATRELGAGHLGLSCDVTDAAACRNAAAATLERLSRVDVPVKAFDAARHHPGPEPRVIICDTRMGKGVPFLEARERNHFLRVEPDEWQQALAILDAGRVR